MGYMIVKEDRIIIKPHKGTGIEVLAMLAIVLPCFFILTKELYDYVKNNGDLMLLYYMAVFWLFVLVCIAFAAIRSNRTFIMDREGCAVVLGKYYKKYRWEDLKTKYMFYTTQARIKVVRYGYVIFYSSKLRKSKRMVFRENVYRRYDLLHPVSFVRVGFKGKFEQIPSKSERKQFEDLAKLDYVVEEEVFLEKLKNWNVELERLF